jgi:metal-sulfur cluster biosynthetic enzyme
MTESDEELKQRIIEVLKGVIDPETFIDVITMNLIPDLKVNNGVVDVIFRPSTPTCPLGVQLAYSIKHAIKGVEGVKKVNMTVVDFIMANELNKMLAEDDLCSGTRCITV